MNIDELGYKKSNREKKMTPKRGLFWCDYCDASIVGERQKCTWCGNRMKSKRLKRERCA